MADVKNDERLSQTKLESIRSLKICQILDFHKTVTSLLWLQPRLGSQTWLVEELLTTQCEVFTRGNTNHLQKHLSSSE